MEENQEMIELEQLVAGLEEEEMNAYPQAQIPTASATKYLPWVAIGGIIAGSKGVSIIPKGQTYPSPVPKPVVANSKPIQAGIPPQPVQVQVPNAKLEDELAETKRKLSELETKLKEKEEEIKKKEEEEKKKSDEMTAQLMDLKQKNEEKDEEIKKLKCGKKLSMDTSTDLSNDKVSFEDILFKLYK